jgi:hypothetical protein
VTPEDLEQITAIFAGAEHRMAETIARTVDAAKAETIEAMRDIQTEILSGIEALARCNFARMHRLETSDSTTNARITALEERVLYLETRPPRPQ